MNSLLVCYDIWLEWGQDELFAGLFEYLCCINTKNTCYPFLPCYFYLGKIIV